MEPESKILEQSIFTDKDRALLELHIGFYTDLDAGTREATTDLQKQFVEVCRGNRLPKTDHEVAYWRYKHWLAAARERVERTEELEPIPPSAAPPDKHTHTPNRVEAHTSGQYDQIKDYMSRAQAAVERELIGIETISPTTRKALT